MAMTRLTRAAVSLLTPCFLYLTSFLSGCNNMNTSNNPSPATQPAAGATITIDSSTVSPAVSRRLFGKFTEHLGTNVYEGMWAQLCANPEFAPASRWPKPQDATRLISIFAKGRSMPELEQGPKQGLAPLWAGEGVESAEVVTVDGRDVQQVTALAAGAAIRTPMFLPLHRVRKYELSLKARNVTGGAGVGPAGAKADATVSLQTIDGTVLAEKALPLTSEWTVVKVVLEVPAAHDHKPGRPYALAISTPGSSTVQLRRVLLFPADHVDGWDVEVVDLMKKARLPLLRFPGGNFVSGYKWTDGVGDIDSRPTLPNPAWPTLEFNHVGTDEWLRLCEIVGCEPMICVNAGNGTPAEARAWIDYCNAPADTPMGKKRAANGHPKPYNVRLWEVGNELFGDWQIGYTDAKGYAKRYAEFIKELRRPGEDLWFIANGDQPQWNAEVVEANGAEVQSLSVHWLIGGSTPADADWMQVFREYMAWSAGVGELAARHYRCMENAGLPPRLAITELMTFAHHDTLPKPQTSTEMLYLAGVTFAAVRSEGKIEMITHSAMLNHGGGLRKERGVVYANPVWWATHLFASQDCLRPMASRVDGPTFDVEKKHFAGGKDVPVVDAVALADDGGRTITIFVINRSPDKAITAKIRLKSATTAGTVEIVTVAGQSPLGKNTWQQPKAVHPAATSGRMEAGQMTIELPPVSLVRVTVKPKP